MQFFKQHKALTIAFSVALVVMLVFFFKLIATTVYWADVRHVDQPIAGWMTPRYVSKSWNVPPDIVAGVLALEKNGDGRRVTLDQISDLQDREVETLADELVTAIKMFRESRGE